MCSTISLVGGLITILAAAGCGGADRSLPTAPSPTLIATVGATNALVTFTDQRSGFSTSDVRDAQEQIVQFSTTGELIWRADGRTLPGYAVQGKSIPAEASCACSLVVRFGVQNGERRAYLTADYGHDNPGTLVDLEITGDKLTVSRTTLFAPGTNKLFGVVTELTERGPIPLQNAGIWLLNEEMTGWQVAQTDNNGYYELRGLYSGSRALSIIKDGFESVRNTVTMTGDTQFDGQLVRN
jgi:hypothetical protein